MSIHGAVEKASKAPITREKAFSDRAEFTNVVLIEREHMSCTSVEFTRGAGSTVAESLVVLYQVGTHQIRRRRRAA